MPVLKALISSLSCKSDDIEIIMKPLIELKKLDTLTK